MYGWTTDGMRAIEPSTSRIHDSMRHTKRFTTRLMRCVVHKKSALSLKGKKKKDSDEQSPAYEYMYTSMESQSGNMIYLQPTVWHVSQPGQTTDKTLQNKR